MVGLGIITSTLALEMFSSGFLLAVGAYEVAKRTNKPKHSTRRK